MQVFLLEMSEAKRVVPGSPSVMYSKDTPAEIVSLAKGQKGGIGYLTFCMFSSFLFKTILLFYTFMQFHH